MRTTAFTASWSAGFSLFSLAGQAQACTPTFTAAVFLLLPALSALAQVGSPIAPNGRYGGIVLERKPGADAANGEKWAKVFCQTCHVFPEPDLLDKASWEKFILPKMSFYLGINQLNPAHVPRYEQVKASGLFPATNLLSNKDWDDVVAYYLDSAPAVVLPQGPREPIKVGLKLFAVQIPEFRRKPALTTLVGILPQDRMIYSGDATTQGLDLWNSTGKVVRTLEVGNIPISFTRSGRDFNVACIGNFFPDEERIGQLITFKRTDKGLQRKVLLSELPRVAFLESPDLNGDGKTDFVLSMFGFLTGRFSWYENLGDDKLKEHVLLSKPGAVRSLTRDFNNDGALDVAALFGQDTEALMIYFNDKKGGFTSKEVFRKSPSQGHTYFEMADFNKDGRLDFVVTSGDNADFPSPTKRYHGVRIYFDKGDGNYEEGFFYPLNGAFKALARDFDQDGDLDLATISFFPDYKKSPEESFVYLENQGGLRFTASTFAEHSIGHWLTMDAGDLDGDGDEDIVLGSLIEVASDVPKALKAQWDLNSPSIVILRNTLRQIGFGQSKGGTSAPPFRR